MGCVNEPPSQMVQNQQLSQHSNINKQQNQPVKSTEATPSKPKIASQQQIRDSTKNIEPKTQENPAQESHNLKLSNSLTVSTVRKNRKPIKGPQDGQTLAQFSSRKFKENDKGNKGYLTLAELRQILKQCIANDLSEREIRESRRIVDDNNNKKVEENELLELMEIYYKK